MFFFYPYGFIVHTLQSLLLLLLVLSQHIYDYIYIKINKQDFDNLLWYGSVELFKSKGYSIT